MNIVKSLPAKINTALMNGYPDKCILDAAVTSDADIIIMGPKRLKGIKSRIIGSVTKSVSINSPKPVLVVKPSQADSSDKMKILFATDGSDYARKAGETLSIIPFHDNTEITVLHVITPAFYDVPDRFMTKMDQNDREDLKNFSSQEMRESQKIIAQMVEHLMKRFSNIRTLTRTGDPSDEILQTANELNADMIVVGSKGMGGFRGIVESLSRYILSAADCSVLIGKTERL
jgi:nucleotide-binding universal stress UspA family protein